MTNESTNLLKQAEEEVANKNFSTALDLVNKSIELSPNESDAYVLKGIILSETKQTAFAATAYEKAIEIDPQNASAYSNYAMHLYQAGNKEKAITLAEAALQIDPDNQTAKEIRILLKPEEVISPNQVIPSSSPEILTKRRVKLIEQLGDKWTKIAWAILSLGMVVIVANLFMTFPEMERLKALGHKKIDEKLLIKNLEQAYGIWFVLIGVIDPILRLSALTWTIMDVYNRKRSWLWAIVVLLLNYIGFLIFLLFGRKSKAKPSQ